MTRDSASRTTAPITESGDELPRAASLLFAPIDKRAFGAAVGVASGLLIFAITVREVVARSPTTAGLALLDQYFPGYTVSWMGTLVGLAWGFALGFCAGWFVAFARNVVLAISLFMIRSRAELAETRDFLDHI